MPHRIATSDSGIRATFRGHRRAQLAIATLFVDRTRIATGITRTEKRQIAGGRVLFEGESSFVRTRADLPAPRRPRGRQLFVEPPRPHVSRHTTSASVPQRGSPLPPVADSRIPEQSASRPRPRARQTNLHADVDLGARDRLSRRREQPRVAPPGHLAIGREPLLV